MLARNTSLVSHLVYSVLGYLLIKFVVNGTEDERAKTVQRAQPHILNRGVISTQDAEKLFKMYGFRDILLFSLTSFVSYFDKMNDSVSLLDSTLYTPPLTAVRSPFLFTVSEYPRRWYIFSMETDVT